MTPPVLTYSGAWLDRVSGRRSDPRWIEETLARPDATVIPLWRDRCLVGEGGSAPVAIRAAQAGSLLASAAGDPVFLGVDGDAGVFAADLSPLDERRAVEAAGASAALDVRALIGALSPREAATLAYARGILHWNRRQRFCGVCGAETESRNGGHLRACRRDGCGTLFFPRIEPAIIVLVEAPGPPRRCLLGRHQGADADAYAALAGFVEIGESLEDAVRREVAEEAGVRLDTVSYQASQAWPFPAGLMIGFRARAASDAFDVDHDELEEARWFTRDELRELMAAGRDRRDLFNADSIEKFLVDGWLREQA